MFVRGRLELSDARQLSSSCAEKKPQEFRIRVFWAHRDRKSCSKSSGDRWHREGPGHFHWRGNGRGHARGLRGVLSEFDRIQLGPKKATTRLSDRVDFLSGVSGGAITAA